MSIDLQTGGYDERRGLVVDQPVPRCHGNPIRRSRARAWRPNVPLSLVDTASRAITIEGYAPRSDEDLLFLLQRCRPRTISRRCASRLLAGREFTRTRRRRRAAGGDRQRDPGAADVADAGERHWQTPAKRHRRMARSDRRRARRQVLAPVGRAAAVRVLPAAAIVHARR